MTDHRPMTPPEEETLTRPRRVPRRAYSEISYQERGERKLLYIRFRVQRELTVTELMFAPVFYRSTGVFPLYFDPQDDWNEERVFDMARNRLTDRLHILNRVLTDMGLMETYNRIRFPVWRENDQGFMEALDNDQSPFWRDEN